MEDLIVDDRILTFILKKYSVRFVYSVHLTQDNVQGLAVMNRIAELLRGRREF